MRAPFGTYPDAVLTGDIVSRTGIVGRLITVSAVGGLIAAAMALPVVATTGVVLRDQANKAAAPAAASFGAMPAALGDPDDKAATCWRTSTA